MDASKGTWCRGGWLLLALLLACHNPYERGLESLQRGDLDGARSAAEEGLADCPEDVDLHLLMAEVRLRQAEYEAAADFAEAALALEDIDEERAARAHLLAADAYEALDRPVETAFHRLAAHDLGALPNDGPLRQLLESASARALVDGRPADALELLREARRLRLEAGQPDDRRLAELIVRVGEGYASALIQRGEDHEAVALLEALMAEFPFAGELMLLRGVVLVRLGREEEARQVFHDYASASPSEAAARYEAAAHAVAEHLSTDLAIDLFEAALAADPTRRESHVGLAEARFRTARVEEAAAGLDAYLAMAARSPALDLGTAYVDAHRAALEAGQIELALEYLERGSAAVHDVALATELAEFHLRRGRPAVADEMLRAFVESSSDRGASAEAVGDWYLDRGQPTAAAEYYRQAAEAPGARPDVYLKLARAYAVLDWPFELTAAVESYLQAAGGGAEAANRAAQILAGAQLWAEAARVLEPVYQADPTRAEVARRLAVYYYYAGQPERERAIYEALMEASDNPGVVAIGSADTYLERGDYSAAIAWLERAAEVPSSRERALLRLGRAHQMLGQHEAMWSAYERYLEGAGHTPDAYQAVLDEFRRHRFAEQAVQLLERMVERWPGREDLRLELGLRLIETGDLGRIREAFRDYVMHATDPALAARSAVWSLVRYRHFQTAQELLETLAREDGVRGLDLSAARLHLDLSREYASSDRDRQRAHLASARRYFRAFLESEPDAVAELIMAAGLMANAGFLDLAVDAYRAARARGADLSAQRRAYADALIGSGIDLDEALRLYRAELAASTDGVEVALEGASRFAAAGSYDAALEMLGVAMGRAQGDAARRQVFEAGAELLLQSGDVEGLVSLANAYVEGSRNQLLALQVSAAPFIRAGRWGLARARLELARQLAPGQTEVLAQLAHLDVLAGDVEAAFRQFAELADRADFPWRAWWAFADRLETPAQRARALQAAADAGAEDPRVFVELGVARSRLGQTDAAVDAFEEALDRVNRTPQSSQRRREIYQPMVTALGRAGRFDLVESYLDRALQDLDIRPYFLLTAADLAWSRGDLNRGRQLVRTHLELGGALGEVIALELAHGFAVEPVERMAELVLDGDPAQATAILADHFAALSDRSSADLMGVWIDQLARRGAEVTGLRSRLVGSWLRRGDLEAAAAALAAQSADDLDSIATVAATRALAGDTDGALEALAQYERRADQGAGSGSAGALRIALATIEIGGAREALEQALPILAGEGASELLAIAYVDWLVSNGRVDESLDYLAELAWSEQVGESRAESAVERASGARLEALDRLAQHGYLREAADLASREVERFAIPDAQLRQAIVYAVQLGEAGQADQLTERYLRLAAGHAGSLLDLGRALATVGAAERSLALIEPILRRGTPEQARDGLGIVLRASAASGDEETAERAVALFMGRSGGRHSALLEVARRSRGLGRWADAAAAELEAYRMLPGQAGPLSEATRLLAMAGAEAELTEQLEGVSGQALLDLRDLVVEPAVTALDAVLRGRLQERYLEVVPADFEGRAARLRSLLLAGEEVRAADLLETLAAPPFDHPRARQQLLRAMTGLDAPMALDLARRQLARADGDPLSDWLAAELLGEAGEIDTALAALSEAATGFPAAPQRSVEVARQALGWGRAESAAQLAEQVLEQRPDATEALGVLAAARILLGRQEAAERDLERYVAQSDRPAEGLASAVGAFLEVGDGERAGRWLERLLHCVDLGADGELRLVGMARGLRALAGADRPGQALALVERTAPALLRHPEVLGDLSGLVRLVEGADPDLAVGILRAALAQRPGDPETMALLADQLARRSEAGSAGEAEAVALARQALVQSPRQSIEGWLALARVSRRAGRVDEASQTVITAALLLRDTGVGWPAATVDEVEALAAELAGP